MLFQDIELQSGHGKHSSEEEEIQADDVIHSGEEEFRVVNIILHPLGQHDHGEGSIHRVLHSPTHLDSSNGSWDLLRELYEIEGGEASIEEELKHREDEAARQLQQTT